MTDSPDHTKEQAGLQMATFAAGCFWCTEAIFKRLKGVDSVISGYAGGNEENPSYMQVSSGRTNHAESVQIIFEPKIIPYDKLLDIFWHTHNPCTKNRQDADIGTQYRSVIFYHNDEQRRVAEQSKADLEKSGYYKDPIVTEIIPFSTFYEAEDYHQNYYDNAPQNPYCAIVIDPKVQKLLKEYGNDVKDEYKM